MFSIILFVFSGVVLVTLILAKRAGERRGETLLILKAISKSDKYLRVLREYILHTYFHGKERVIILTKKQLPLRAKSFWNRALVWSKETTRRLIGDLRDSRLLRRRPDGMSEFFKNISDIEKGNGEINDVYEEREEETVIRDASETTESPARQISSKKVTKKKIFSRKKRLVVTETK